MCESTRREATLLLALWSDHLRIYDCTPLFAPEYLLFFKLVRFQEKT